VEFGLPSSLPWAQEVASSNPAARLLPWPLLRSGRRGSGPPPSPGVSRRPAGGRGPGLEGSWATDSAPDEEARFNVARFSRRESMKTLVVLTWWADRVLVF
jgi:hypothetical protein